MRRGGDVGRVEVIDAPEAIDAAQPADPKDRRVAGGAARTRGPKTETDTLSSVRNIGPRRAAIGGKLELRVGRRMSSLDAGDGRRRNIRPCLASKCEE